MESWVIKASIEAILVAADEHVTLAAMAKGMGVSELEVEDALREFEDDLIGQDKGVQVRHRAGGVRLEVKPQYIDVVCNVLPKWSPRKLTKVASETLALIAYHQPITTSELTAMRGTDCSATVQTLRNRKLVARSAQLGPRRQKLWRTTPHFLEVHNLPNLEALYLEGTKERIFPSLFNEDVEEEDGEELEEDVDLSESVEQQN